MVADRRIREFAPAHEPHWEGLRPDPHANQNSPELEPIPKAGSAKRSFLHRLLREAALAIRAGDARAAELQQELDEKAVLEYDMAETIRSERARADAAEERAKAAEARADCLEQRAQAMIRSLEGRVEAAEARLQAAQSWITKVRRTLFLWSQISSEERVAGD